MMKTLPFTQDRLMEQRKFMAFGLPKTTGRPTLCLLVMEFYLTTSLQGGGRPL